jgi:hypothetical protein
MVVGVGGPPVRSEGGLCGDVNSEGRDGLQGTLTRVWRADGMIGVGG